MKKETIEEFAERIAKAFDIDNYKPIMELIIDGAKLQQNDCIEFINKLEDESFDGWSKEAISGYLTACMTIKQKILQQFKKK